MYIYISSYINMYMYIYIDVYVYIYHITYYINIYVCVYITQHAYSARTHSIRKAHSAVHSTHIHTHTPRH